MLSGDRNPIVKQIAEELGIAEYYGECSPLEKTAYVQRLKSVDNHILMVGDGLNNAPSLQNADISMSPASALDIVQNTADIIFQGDILSPIIKTYNIAQQTFSFVKQNFI